ncbi:ribosome-binding protein [Hyalangium rubrum]|uniref:Ribosome-binding protein n=1 Tax=Hyalangium rubrum TaxID=3103134 RepID=A0ABU5H7P0_9BACT|nr:ribosome-binding protein [Hyalangium sp. s54d21]MDY7229475.1 ribosome-binding protein [Hyalangium sp. s54d21]
MPFLPIITNNLGKIAATMTAGALGYASRKTIGRWLAGDDEPSETQESMRQKAQEVRQLQGQMTLAELDRKHSELLEKLTQANTAAMGEMRSLTKDVKTEVADLRKGLQGQLDTQRAETMRLGKELREMKERQEKMDASIRSTAPGTGEQQPTRRKTGNGATGLMKPSMGDEARTSSSRASARSSRTM